jgi:hypothetical protein
MDTVTIEKDKLLKKIKQNRDEHKLIYDEAMTGWKEEVLETLKNAVQLAENYDEYNTFFDIQKPEHHLAEYDRIIEMIEWNINEIIDLDPEEFNRFVRDKWNWTNDFLSTSSSYSTVSSSSSSSSLDVARLINKKMGN